MSSRLSRRRSDLREETDGGLRLRARDVRVVIAVWVGFLSSRSGRYESVRESRSARGGGELVEGGSQVSTVGLVWARAWSDWGVGRASESSFAAGLSARGGLEGRKAGRGKDRAIVWREWWCLDAGVGFGWEGRQGRSRMTKGKGWEREIEKGRKREKGRRVSDKCKSPTWRGLSPYFSTHRSRSPHTLSQHQRHQASQSPTPKSSYQPLLAEI